MSASANSLETIEDFLAQKRFALVGLSRDPNHFSAYLYREFCKRGYQVVPVNPNADTSFPVQCFASVQEITPAVDSVLVMTPASETEAVVRQCARVGVKRIWLHRTIGEGAVSPEAVALCRERGMALVEGECPFMFLPNNGFHKIHGLIRKISGKYPQHANK